MEKDSPANPPYDTQDASDGAETSCDADTAEEASRANAGTADAVSRHPASLAREVLLVGTICAAQLMTQAALAMAVVPLHIIGDSFGVSSPGELSWYASSYSLTVGTFILVAGRLGDVFGHRLVFTVGFAWFGLWSLLAGFAAYVPDGRQGSIFFDCCRALQGIGPAMLLPNGVAILGRTYVDGRRKHMVFSLFGAVAPGGFVIGSVFASLLAQRVWWPWAYWVMAAACTLFAALGLLAIPRDEHCDDDSGMRPRGVGIRPWLARLDVGGAAAGVAGLVLVNFAWNQGPVVGWTVPYTYALLVVGIAFLGLFAWIEARAEHPLLPRAIYTSELGWVLGCIGAGWSSFGVLVLYYYQIMEVIKGDSPLLASAKWSGAAPAGVAAALTTGYLMAHVRPSLLLLAAMAAFLAGQLLLATLPVHQVYWSQTFLMSIITPWGM